MNSSRGTGFRHAREKSFQNALKRRAINADYVGGLVLKVGKLCERLAARIAVSAAYRIRKRNRRALWC